MNKPAVHITEITFSIARTMPLYPLTRHEDDQYANVKPHVSAKAIIDGDATKDVIDRAFEQLRNVCYEQLAIFKDEFTKGVKPPKGN
jgi:hypothetical protein